MVRNASVTQLRFLIGQAIDEYGRAISPLADQFRSREKKTRGVDGHQFPRRLAVPVGFQNRRLSGGIFFAIIWALVINILNR
jgi:hypothetical protein